MANPPASRGTRTSEAIAMVRGRGVRSRGIRRVTQSVKGIAGETTQPPAGTNSTGPAVWAGPGRNSYRARAVSTDSDSINYILGADEGVPPPEAEPSSCPPAQRLRQVISRPFR